MRDWWMCKRQNSNQSRVQFLFMPSCDASTSGCRLFAVWSASFGQWWTWIDSRETWEWKNWKLRKKLKEIVMKVFWSLKKSKLFLINSFLIFKFVTVFYILNRYFRVFKKNKKKRLLLSNFQSFVFKFWIDASTVKIFKFRSIKRRNSIKNLMKFKQIFNSAYIEVEIKSHFGTF